MGVEKFIYLCKRLIQKRKGRQNEDIRKHYMVGVWRSRSGSGVSGGRCGADDNDYRHSVRPAVHQDGASGPVAVWLKGGEEGASARLSGRFHECVVVFRGRRVDMAHPCVLRTVVLHHDYRHTFW